MCTVMLAWQTDATFPIILAANRDEFLDRPSAPPKFHRMRTRLPCIAPQDLRRGGTWIGMNERRVVAAITNRDCEISGIGRRSRGSIVARALAAASAVDAAVALAAIDPAEFRPFHLVVADVTHAFLLWCDGATLRTNVLTPGVHTVTQRDLGASDSPRRVARHFAGIPLDRRALGTPLETVLAQHDPHDPYQGACVHDGDDYGTHSSTVIAVSAVGICGYRYTDGPPCSAPWQTVSSPTPTGSSWSPEAFHDHPIDDPWSLYPIV